MSASKKSSGALHMQEQLDALLQENASLRAELRRVNSSLRMRAVGIIAEASASPRELSRAPSRLWTLGREILASRAWRRVVLGLECGLPDDPLRGATPNQLSARPVSALGRHVLSRSDADLPTNDTDDPAVAAALERIAELTRLAANGPTWSERSATPLTPYATRRVLMALHTGEPDIVNGYSRRSHEILTALGDLGWDMQAALRTPSSDTAPLPPEHAARYHRIGEVAPGAAGLDDYVNAYAHRLYADIDRLRPALVHAASNHVTGRAAALAARRAGLPFLYEVRGLWEVTRESVEPDYAHALGNKAQRRLELETARAADRLFVNGEALESIFIEAGIPADRIINIPNGFAPEADDEKLASRLKAEWGLDDRTVIGFVGSITAYEGLADVFMACARLDALDFQILMVGDGTEVPRLRAEASRLGIADRVTWVGAVPPDAARAAYRFIDIAPLVRPDSPVSRLVPPLKPLDAMAGDAALLVSDLAPLQEFAAEGRGVIANPQDITALAAAIADLLQNEPHRTAMAATAREWVESTRKWSQIAERIGVVYSEILGG